MKVSFILGAGFSFNAKMPLVKDISAKFLQRPLYKYTLYFGSGEWKWTEWACDADLHNGKIHALGLEISFFMELMIDRYLESVGEELLNYEEFYNYLLKVRYETPDQFNAYLHEAQARYKKEFQGSETIFTDIPDYEIFSCFYHLVDDLLWLRMEREKIYEAYRPYTDFLSREDIQANIFTLNHDLLMENLLQHWEINYRDGFSTENKILFDDKMKRLPVFDRCFGDDINLLKLHGSIDMYEYRYNQDQNRHKGCDYFKTLNYHAKHLATDVADDGQIIQNYTPRIIPQFITGQRKLDIIRKDKMYSCLYSFFEKHLKDSDRLIVVGYSFADKHINSVIESALKDIPEVIHIDPFAEFPFQHGNYRKIDPITDEVDL